MTIPRVLLAIDELLRGGGAALDPPSPREARTVRVSPEAYREVAEWIAVPNGMDAEGFEVGVIETRLGNYRLTADPSLSGNGVEAD